METCRKGLGLAIRDFTKYLAEILDEESSEKKDKKLKDNRHVDNRVFIVHGHDGELKQSVARFLEKLSIEAIILSEKTNNGKTIIEKLESYSDVGCAICLFTADDACIGNGEERKMRARQNVVLETGYFIGKIGRDRVVFLADKDVELPSDLSGVVYANKGNWQTDVAKELKSMGYDIDFNRLF